MINFGTDRYQRLIEANSELIDDISKTIDELFTGNDWLVQRRVQWIFVRHGPDPELIQGWKLHVSATDASAIAILRRVSAVLLGDPCSFKVADTINTLRILNDSHYPREHAGKFITIYPPTAEQFRRLVYALAQATEGCPGPKILSDKRYANSIVHYRYGAFRGVSKRLKGRNIPCILNDRGELVEDTRHAWFTKPDWVEDMILEGDVQEKRPLVGADTRYSVAVAIRHANRGGVYKACRESDGQWAIIKEARRYVGVDRNGNDVTDALVSEFNALRALQGKGVAPEPYALMECGGDRYLAQELISGDVLPEYVNDVLVRQKGEPSEMLAALDKVAVGIAEALAVVHEAGLVLRDLSRNNIIVTPEHQVRLVDLELATTAGEECYLYPSGGTFGYFDRATRSQAPAICDDLYSLGCVLYFIYTGRDPLWPEDDPATAGSRSHLEKIKGFLLLRNAKGLLRRELIDLIVHLMDPDPTQRPTARGVASRIARGSVPVGSHRTASFKPDGAGLAAGIMEYLRRTVRPDQKRPWPTTSFGEDNAVGCVQNGVAGIGMFVLRATAQGLGDAGLLEHTMHRCKADLESSDVARGLAGYVGAENSLYFGKYGMTWFLIDAAKAVLGMGHRLVDEVLCHARSLPARSDLADVVLGTAGYGMANLHLWLVSGDTDFYNKAVAAGEALLECARPFGDGNVWPLYEQVYWGYAHGNAGISYFLSLLYKATGDRRYLDCALASINVVVDNAQVRGGIASWDMGPDNRTNWPHWCNGSSGVGTVLIRMHLITGDSRLRDYARMAAADVVHRCWASGLCYCHGLAGNGDFLLDMVRWCGDSDLKAASTTIAEVMYAQRVAANECIVFPDESGDAVAADLGCGLCGVGEFFLRYSGHGSRIFMNDELLTNGSPTAVVPGL